MKHQQNAIQLWRKQTSGIWRPTAITAIAQLRDWAWCYLPAELVALAVAVLGVTLAAMLTSNELILVAASVYSGSISYYSVLIASTYLADRRARPATSSYSRRQTLLSSIRGLTLDFGGAELLDSLLVSPVLLYFCLRALPNHQLAVVLSELASTIVFYTTVMVARAARTSLAQQHRRP